MVRSTGSDAGAVNVVLSGDEGAPTKLLFLTYYSFNSRYEVCLTNYKSGWVCCLHFRCYWRIYVITDCLTGSSVPESSSSSLSCTGAAVLPSSSGADGDTSPRTVPSSVSSRSSVLRRPSLNGQYRAVWTADSNVTQSVDS